MNSYEGRYGRVRAREMMTLTENAILKLKVDDEVQLLASACGNTLGVDNPIEIFGVLAFSGS